jgi:polyhydroxyalkanoate synthesis regulator phasin
MFALAHAVLSTRLRRNDELVAAARLRPLPPASSIARGRSMTPRRRLPKRASRSRASSKSGPDPTAVLLEEVRSQNRVVIELVQGCATKTEVAALREDVATLKEDVTELKGDVATLREDVTELKGDVATLREDVTELKGDVATLREDMTE